MHITKEAKQYLQESRITTYDPITIPLPLIHFNGIQVATIGNFSAVIGKPKSKKSFFLLYLISQALKTQTKEIKITMDEDKKFIAYFDTEQSKFKSQKSVNLICKMTGTDSEGMFLNVHNLREYEAKMRIDIIEEYLQDDDNNTSLIIIDGIRDLVSSINDELQATYITSKLMQWSQKYNVHIIVVLHQNKADYNARGHLGTEIINKAETVISVSKDPKEANTSIIKCELAREKEFEPLMLTIDENGLPYIRYTSASKQTKPQQTEKPNPEVINDIFNTIFQSHQKINYADLKNKLKEHCIKNELPNGDTKLKKIITEYTINKFLTTKRGPKSTTIYQLNS